MGISWQVGAYDEDDLEKLKATGDCSGCDLSKVFLRDRPAETNLLPDLSRMQICLRQIYQGQT